MHSSGGALGLLRLWLPVTAISSYISRTYNFPSNNWNGKKCKFRWRRTIPLNVNVTFADLPLLQMFFPRRVSNVDRTFEVLAPCIFTFFEHHTHSLIGRLRWLLAGAVGMLLASCAWNKINDPKNNRWIYSSHPPAHRKFCHPTARPQFHSNQHSFLWSAADVSNREA